MRDQARVTRHDSRKYLDIEFLESKPIQILVSWLLFTCCQFLGRGITFVQNL